MKKVFLALGVLLVLLLVAFLVLFGPMVLGNAPLADGAELPGGARIVKDGYVAIDVLPTAEKDVALIDCGNDENGEAVLAELRRRGLGPEAVKAVFLTHGHPDHVAGCHLFKDASVLALGPDIPIAEGTAR